MNIVRTAAWTAAFALMAISILEGLVYYDKLIDQSAYDLYGSGGDRTLAVNLSLLGCGLAAIFSLWRVIVNART